MKLLILTSGSRGDVQPYVALGRGLQGAGHAVTVCTHNSFEPLVRQYGLDYAFLNDDLLRLADTEAGRGVFESAGGPLGMIKTMAELTRQIGPAQRRMLDQEWVAAQGMDAIVYHPKAMGGLHIAEKVGVPGFLAVVAPGLVPTGAFPQFMLPALPFGSAYNRLTYALFDQMTAASLGVVQRWRRDVLGLPPGPRSPSALERADRRPVPALLGYSPLVVPRPADWPETIAVTGFWFLDRPADWSPPPELAAFLEAGPPPVYIGFGSMAGRSPERLTRAALEAVAAAGCRAVLATGWGGLRAAGIAVPESVHVLESAPHDWLFPRMSALVHHGGAGTVAAGLRAGKPAVIVPFFGDQPFWGRRLAELGVGPAPIPQKQLTGPRLAEALHAVTRDAALRERAAAVGEIIWSEDGVGQAVAFIERHLTGPATATSRLS
jgi:sterol 3beta-glucosyltransferase